MKFVILRTAKSSLFMSKGKCFHLHQNFGRNNVKFYYYSHEPLVSAQLHYYTHIIMNSQPEYVRLRQWNIHNFISSPTK